MNSLEKINISYIKLTSNKFIYGKRFRDNKRKFKKNTNINNIDK